MSIEIVTNRKREIKNVNAAEIILIWAFLLPSDYGEKV
jgi:hypothetical protein